jgi:hypothetical protein
MIATAGLLLVGCTAARTLQDDATVRSVAVVSLVDESASIRRLGLTVFNNNEAIVDQDGKLKQAAVDTVIQRLKSARPQWVVKVGDMDRNGVGGLDHKSSAGRRSASDNVNALVDLARRLDVDQLFVVEDTAGENNPGHGVGITFRAITGDPGTVMVHGFVALVVMDRNGKVLVTRGAINNNPQPVPNTELGLRSDMSTLSDSKVKENVSLALQRRLKASVEEAMTRAGY